MIRVPHPRAVDGLPADVRAALATALREDRGVAATVLRPLGLAAPVYEVVVAGVRPGSRGEVALMGVRGFVWCEPGVWCWTSAVGACAAARPN